MKQLSEEDQNWLESKVRLTVVNEKVYYKDSDVEEKLLEMQQRIQELEKRNSELERSLENETYLKEESYKREDCLTEKNKELARQRFRNYNNEEYIIFFDDGEDYPETMSAPVVMGASKFRELFYAREQLNKESK